MDDMTLRHPYAAIALVTLGVIILLHVLPAILKGRGGHLLGLVCLGLHIPLMPLMLFGGFTLELMILAYALSAFVFTAVKFITYELRVRKATFDTTAEEGESEE